MLGAASLQVLLVLSAMSAQSISIGLRGSGSVPTGSFAQQQVSPPGSDVVIEGAKSGFGYGLDVGIGIGPIGIYGGFDHIKFDCQTETCQSDGKYTLQGVSAGVKLAIPMANRFRPFVKGGVTFQDLQGGYGASSSNVLQTDKTPGYEVGVGLDYSLLGILVSRRAGALHRAEVQAEDPRRVNSHGVDRAGRQLFHVRPRALGAHSVLRGGRSSLGLSVRYNRR
jgi:hypothetical protein